MATLCDFRDQSGEALDEGIALFFPGPASYTGEDVLELHCHGGQIVGELVLEAVLKHGARLAEPGEFSRRAFLNDKLDLSQAEAVADLIDSQTRQAAVAAQRSLQGEFSSRVLSLNTALTELRAFVEAAMDFPEEEIDFLSDAALMQQLQSLEESFTALERAVHQGVLLRDGAQIVIAGLPNAGKSSLLNALAGEDLAIVTSTPGTTRDLVRAELSLDGLPVRIVDTAGLRDNAEEIEAEGMRRAREQLALADHALLVVDGSDAPETAATQLVKELPPQLAYTVACNKQDVTGLPAGSMTGQAKWVSISAHTGAGLDALRERLTKQLGFESPGEGSIIARQRHLDALRCAREHFEAGRNQLQQHRAGELLAEELLQAQNSLAEITGEFGSDDLLGEIFSRFCIGK